MIEVGDVSAWNICCRAIQMAIILYRKLVDFFQILVTRDKNNILLL